MTTEPKKRLVPTFELADCPMWSMKTGEFLGNYDDTCKGVVKHFSAESKSRFRVIGCMH